MTFICPKCKRSNIENFSFAQTEVLYNPFILNGVEHYHDDNRYWCDSICYSCGLKLTLNRQSKCYAENCNWRSSVECYNGEFVLVEFKI